MASQGEDGVRRLIAVVLGQHTPGKAGKHQKTTGRREDPPAGWQSIRAELYGRVQDFGCTPANRSATSLKAVWLSSLDMN